MFYKFVAALSIFFGSAYPSLFNDTLALVSSVFVKFFQDTTIRAIFLSKFSLGRKATETALDINSAFDILFHVSLPLLTIMLSCYTIFKLLHFLNQFESLPNQNGVFFIQLDMFVENQDIFIKN